MANYQIPLTGKVAWPCILVQIIILSLLMLVSTWIFEFFPFLIAAISYALIAQLLRRSQAKHHRKGVRLVLKKQYEESIPWFIKSVHHFEKKPWLDKYRCITLLSATGYGYREMGLCNLGFCYAQLGKREEAIEFYNKVLQTNPNNGLAITTLNLLNTAKKE